MKLEQQIIDKKITKSKLDFTFKEAVEICKDDIKTLKEYIYIMRSRLLFLKTT